MGRAARPIHDPGNHRASRRQSLRQDACRGTLTLLANPPEIKRSTALLHHSPGHVPLTPAGFRFHKLNGNFDALINQQNSGQTPAFKVRLFSQVIVLTGTMPKDFIFPVPNFGESRNTVHPGHSYDVPARADEPFEVEEIQRMLLIEDRFYMIAVIEYYDIYNERRETRACWSLDVSPSDIEVIQPGETRRVPFTYTAEHNDAT